MIEMRNHFTGPTFAILFTLTAALPGHAEDAAPPTATAAPAQATPAAPPASVPRPSIVPKTAEPASARAADDAAPTRHRHYARHHYRHYAYWEPFPVFLPHLYRHRIYWSRIPWFFF
jgi:hypothetical protein